MLVAEAGSNSSLSEIWTRLTEGLDKVNTSVKDIQKLHGEVLVPSKPCATQEADGNCEDSTKPAGFSHAPPERRRSVLFDAEDDSQSSDEKDDTCKSSMSSSFNKKSSALKSGSSLDKILKRGMSGIPSNGGIGKTATIKTGLWKISSSHQDWSLNRLWDLQADLDQTEFDDFMEDKLSKHFRISSTMRRSRVEKNRTSESSFVSPGLDLIARANESSEVAMKHCEALHPHSRLRLSWDVLSVFAAACDLILLPMVFAFDLTASHTVSAVDWITAIFWSIDMAASCITGYQIGAHVETRLTSVVKHYLLTWFLVDAAIVVSEWYGKIMSESVGGLAVVRAARVVRILRILRVFRLLRLYQTLAKLEDITSSAQLVILFSVARMSAVLMYLVHVLACGWYLIGSTDYFPDSLADDSAKNTASVGCARQRLNGWVLVAEEDGIDARSLEWGYVASFRWTLAQLNGRTDQERRPIAEMIYTSITATITLLFMSIFVGRLTSRMLQLQQLVDKESGYLRVLKKYTETYELSWKTIYIARRHIKDRWTSETENSTEATLLELLPVQTQLDMLFEVRTPILSTHRFFKILCTEFAQAVRDSLVTAVCSETARRMESIFDKGAECSRLIFIESGTFIYSRSPAMKHWLAQRDMEAQAETRRMTVKKMFHTRKRKDDENTEQGSGLCEGRWICEAGLWAQRWYTQGVLVSTTQSKLVSIGRDEFAKALARHPAAHTVCNYYARGFMKAAFEHQAVENRPPSDTFTVDIADAFELTSTEQGAQRGPFRTTFSSTKSSISYAPQSSARDSRGDDGLAGIRDSEMMSVLGQHSVVSYTLDDDDANVAVEAGGSHYKASL
eukprot:TRINITY_DN76313_c0_g1_i1.p1 TRINITY_DN76313_c0_g1~~TRINITY_DN76313_c0_g1_i1.p1  ORF type:complete len:848 (-),score=113.82 TRINITY_DN76313_c0_g1_i1:148-2691(-)